MTPKKTKPGRPRKSGKYYERYQINVRVTRDELSKFHRVGGSRWLRRALYYEPEPDGPAEN